MTATADIRKRFTKQLAALKTAAKTAADAMTTGSSPAQFQPDKNGWTGDVFDLDGLIKPFDRAEHDNDVRKAVSKSSQPGTVGDLAISTLQGDMLAALERSQRLRHASPVRLAMHAAARKYGHGHDAGVFVRGYQSYLTGLLKLSKEPT